MFRRIYYQADDGGGGNEPQVDLKTEPKQEKTFTQDELNAIIKKELAKVESKTAAKLKEIEEAERLKGLSEAERKEEELKKLQSKLAQYEQDKLKTQFKLELSNKGVPSDFADYLNVQDADTAKAAVDFLTQYKTTVTEELTKKVADLEEQLKNSQVRGVPPKAVGGTNSSTLTGLGKMIADNLNKQ